MNHMIRGGLLLVGMLSVLAVAALPAHATFTPRNGVISATSTDTQLVNDAGNILRCPTAEFTGVIDNTGTRISGRLTFSRNATTDCTANLGGGTILPIVVSCPGRITITSTSSVAGTSASGSATFENDASGVFCHITIPALRCSIILRAQGPLTAITFTQATQVLNVNLNRNIVTSASAAPCTASRAATFTGRFNIISVNGVRTDIPTRRGLVTIS